MWAWESIHAWERVLSCCCTVVDASFEIQKMSHWWSLWCPNTMPHLGLSLTFLGLRFGIIIICNMYFILHFRYMDNVKAVIFFAFHSDFISSLSFCSSFDLDVTYCSIFTFDAILFYDYVHFMIYLGSGTLPVQAIWRLLWFVSRKNCWWGFVLKITYSRWYVWI